jgi:thymidylate kinase
MLVEVMGITGSGKSTLIAKLRELNDISKTGYNIEGSSTGLIRTFCRDIILSVCYLIYQKSVLRTTYVVFCESMKREDTIYMRLNLIRNFITKQGAGHKSKLKDGIGTVAISDEGPLHSLSNIFCHYECVPNIQALVSIQENIRIPDVIIKLYVEKEIMLNRTLSRDDPPWPDLEKVQWEKMHANMEMIYEHISNYVINNYPKIKIITVDGANYDENNIFSEIIQLSDARRN